LTAPATAQLLGDANCDGAVDANDLRAEYRTLFGAPPCDPPPFNADTNGDGRLSAPDLSAKAQLGIGAQSHTFSAPFGLESDPSPDPNRRSFGIVRDGAGNLILARGPVFDALWVANTQDWGRGSISQIDPTGLGEVARYWSTTCFSNAGGSRAACDGNNGCCARDDFGRFLQRQMHQAEGPRQAVRTTDNGPTTVAVDHNGDAWVANRAFTGQASVTKVAFDLRDCVERNGRAGIQTSSDANGDGVIDTDCDRNGVPDDINTTCTGGRQKEFLGDDDECVLFTTNIGGNQLIGRAVTLAPTGGPSDAWAATYNDGRLFRIDGATGVLEKQIGVPAPADAMATDRFGMLWVQSGNTLRYFDFRNPSTVGVVRMPSGFTLGNGFGDSSIALDADQNVWVTALSTTPGSTPAVFRYTPDRSSFAAQANGKWTRFTDPGRNAGATGAVRKVVVDDRSPTAYFAWVAREDGWIARIDASAAPPPTGSDASVDASGSPAIRVAGGLTQGAAVDNDQNVWGVSSNGSNLTRVEVAANGTIAPGPDSFSLIAPGVATMPNPWGNGDLTGFALRSFTAARGAYSIVFRGCDASDANWVSVTWDADTPAGTSLSVRARSGPSAQPDASWGPWTGQFPGSAVLTGIPAPLQPNPAAFIQIEISLLSANPTAIPTLSDIGVGLRCS
jgi:hypothetical protein